VYSQEIDDTGFTLKRRTTADLTTNPNWSVSGTYGTSNSSGFLELTITSGSENTLISGSVIYGIQISDQITMLSPFLSGQQTPLIMVQAGCPDSEIQTNWLRYKNPATLNETQHLNADLGTTSLRLFESSDSTPDNEILDTQVDIDKRYVISDPTTAIGHSKTFVKTTCEEGVVSTDNGARAYLSKSGAMVLELASSADDLSQGATENSEFLLAVNSTDILSVENFNTANYIGLFSDYGSTDGSEKTTPAKASCENGTCTVTLYDPGQNLDKATYTLRLNNSETALNKPSSGFISGTISNNSIVNSSAKTTCSINRDYNGSGSYFIACTGESLISQGSKLTLFLVAKG